MSDPTAPLPPIGGGPPPGGYGPPPGGYGPPPGGYGPPPMGPYGPPPRSHGGLLAAALLSVLFVIGSIVVAVVANGDGGQASSATVSRVPLPGSSLTSGATSTGGNIAAPSPVTSLPSSTSVYSPPAAPTPTHQPLSPGAVNRTMETYLYGLVNRNRHELISATCPRLRPKTTGFALQHKYIDGWKGYRYSISADLDYVRIPITVTLASPYSGTRRYVFTVERVTSGTYYVCGFDE